MHTNAPIFAFQCAVRYRQGGRCHRSVTHPPAPIPTSVSVLGLSTDYQACSTSCFSLHDCA